VLEAIQTLLKAEWSGKEITLLTDVIPININHWRDGKQLLPFSRSHL